MFAQLLNLYDDIVQMLVTATNAQVEMRSNRSVM